MKKFLSLALILLLSLPIGALETGSSNETRYGAHIDGQGWVHFVVYSPTATKVALLLFSEADAVEPATTIPMAKQGDDWKVKVRGKWHRPRHPLYVPESGQQFYFRQPALWSGIQRQLLPQ